MTMQIITMSGVVPVEVDFCNCNCRRAQDDDAQLLEMGWLRGDSTDTCVTADVLEAYNRIRG